MRPYVYGLLAVASATPAFAEGVPDMAWTTRQGWLTELRTHPNGARVCTTGKPGLMPPGVAFTIVRSGSETSVMLVDQDQPPEPGSGDMLVFQDGREGGLEVKADSSGYSSLDPSSPYAAAFLDRLAAAPATFEVDGRTYRIDLTGLHEARAELDRCLVEAAR